MKMVIKPIKRNDRKIKETTIIKIFLLNGTVNFPLYPQPCFGAFLEILTVKPVSYGYLYCGLEPDSKKAKNVLLLVDGSPIIMSL